MGLQSALAESKIKEAIKKIAKDALKKPNEVDGFPFFLRILFNLNKCIFNY